MDSSAYQQQLVVFRQGLIILLQEYWMSLSEEGQGKEQLVTKRRGRPEKTVEPFFEFGEDLFTIHDNIFHASILFFTYRIFDRTPSRSKFNPTIGYSVYEKMRTLHKSLKQYYDDDAVAKQFAKQYSQNLALFNFFINSLTFGPSCVIDEYFKLFKFILDSPNGILPSACLQLIHQQGYKYINFNCSVLDQLDVKTPDKKKIIKEFIEVEILKLFQILIHTLHSLRDHQLENKFAYILESQEDLFERGVNTKSKKKIKKE